MTRVVQFDWPRNLVDYLHRVGRVGRVGSTQKCQAVAFMTRLRDVRMAWMIKVKEDHYYSLSICRKLIFMLCRTRQIKEKFF